MILDKFFHSFLYAPAGGYNYTLWIAVGSLIVSICTFINNFFQRHVNKKSYRLSLFKERFSLWNEFQEEKYKINKVNIIFQKYARGNLLRVMRGKDELNKCSGIEELVLCLKKIRFIFFTKKFRIRRLMENSIKRDIDFYINLYKEYDYFSDELNRMEKINNRIKYLYKLREMFLFFSGEGDKFSMIEIKFEIIPEWIKKTSKESINNFFSILIQSDLKNLNNNFFNINAMVMEYYHNNHYSISQINKEIEKFFELFPFFKNYSKYNEIIKDIDDCIEAYKKEIRKITETKNKKIKEINFKKYYFSIKINKMMEKYLYVDD